MNLVNLPTLPGLQMLLSDQSRRAIGTLGELTAWRLLESAGYVVSKASKRRGDLRVVCRETGEITQVEVKCARRGKDKKWRFLLWKNGQQDHRHADVVILLAVLEWGETIPYVVPVSRLADQKQCVITSDPRKYAGKLAVYRQIGSIHL